MQEGPPEGDDIPQSLLLLLPGGFLGPSDYAGLVEAIEAQSGPSMVLYAAVADLDWAALAAAHAKDGGGGAGGASALVNAAIAGALEGAISRGFKPKGSATHQGRVENLVIACHSVSTMWAADFPMKSAAALVLLGTSLAAHDGGPVSVYAYPRPLLHIFGQLDGQYTLARAATAALGAVTRAVQLGQRFMAMHRPLAVIPGMSHAQFSNGATRTERGDLQSPAEQGPLLEAVAGHVACFALASHPDSPPEAVGVAVDRLLRATVEGVALLSPYTEALGRGSLQSTFDSDPDAQGAAIGDVVPQLFAVGAEGMPAAASDRVTPPAHPGELAAAERFCIAAQHRMLRGLPEYVASGVQVIATVHTTLDSFIYSQPTVFPSEEESPGPRLVMHAHCFLLRANLGGPGLYHSKPQSPQYVLKLRRAEVVAYALGLEPANLGGHRLEGSELNSELYQQALAGAAPLVRDTFQARGLPLEFAPDRDMTAMVKSPLDFITAPPTFKYDAPASAFVLTSPLLSTPTQKLPDYDRGAGRFVGNHYIKCMSLAWFQEWLMTEGLRPPEWPR